MYSKLSEIQKELPGITISVSLADLEAWGKGIIINAKKELEQQINDAASETYPSAKKVAEILDVDYSTLWRWKNKGYLAPIEIGGKRRYRMSDVKRILEGGVKK
jgi:hypothetical protein